MCLKSEVEILEHFLLESGSLTSLHYVCDGLFGKSTHIAMISNSVTHLRSYTNSTIADITGNSTQAPISLRQAPMSSG